MRSNTWASMLPLVIHGRCRFVKNGTRPNSGSTLSQWVFERVPTTCTSGFASIFFARWKEYSCDAQTDFGGILHFSDA